MINNLKKAIENDFDKNENYKDILFKIKEVRVMKKFNFKYALIPLCIILTLSFGIKQIYFNTKTSLIENNEKQWIIKEIYTNPSNETIENVAVSKKWEEKSNFQQYNEFLYNNNKYISNNSNIESSKIGNTLGIVDIKGYDTYQNINHYTKVTLYAINNFSEKCILAVKFNNSNDYYLYYNINYYPLKLNDLLNDMNIKEQIQIGIIHYNYWENKNEKPEYLNIEFYDINNSDLIKLLFDNTNPDNIYNDDDVSQYTSDKYSTQIIIDINIKNINYGNITITLTDKGYLITNILGSGKAFYVGKNKIEELTNYLITNYDGYKIVYKSES